MLDHVELISSCLCEMLDFESHLDDNICFYISTKLDLRDLKYCYIMNSFIRHAQLRFGYLEVIFCRHENLNLENL